MSDNNKFSIGQYDAGTLKSYTLYYDRSIEKHGLNLMRITEVDPNHVDLLMRIPIVLNACESMGNMEIENGLLTVDSVVRDSGMIVDQVSSLKAQLLEAESLLQESWQIEKGSGTPDHPSPLAEAIKEFLDRDGG